MSKYKRRKIPTTIIKLPEKENLILYHLSTYGWAYTILLITAFAMWQLEIFNPKEKFNPETDLCLNDLQLKIGKHYATQKYPNITIQDEYYKKAKLINGKLKCLGEFRKKDNCELGNNSWKLITYVNELDCEGIPLSYLNESKEYINFTIKSNSLFQKFKINESAINYGCTIKNTERICREIND